MAGEDDGGGGEASVEGHLFGVVLSASQAGEPEQAKRAQRSA
jgi:hypothetical protein